MLSKYKTATAILLSCLLMMAAGCATIEGAGKDIESAGEAIQDAADNTN